MNNTTLVSLILACVQMPSHQTKSSLSPIFLMIGGICTQATLILTNLRVFHPMDIAIQPLNNLGPLRRSVLQWWIETFRQGGDPVIQTLK